MSTIREYLNMLPINHRDRVIEDYTNFLWEENPYGEDHEIMAKLNEHLDQECGSLEYAVYSTKDESQSEGEFKFWYDLILGYEGKEVKDAL